MVILALSREEKICCRGKVKSRSGGSGAKKSVLLEGKSVGARCLCAHLVLCDDGLPCPGSGAVPISPC